MIIGIVYKSNSEVARKVGLEMVDKLRRRGVQTILDWKQGEDQPDLLMILGGDGTILQAARQFAPLNIPLLNINLGRVGFLTELEVEEVDVYLDELLKKNYYLEKRMLLQVTAWRGGQLLSRSLALNEAAVLKRGISRMIDLRLFIDDTLLANYLADGIICATPTGSTAYSLSAGGPVLWPDMEGIVITPVCPYLLTSKPIVLDSSKNITIIPQSEKGVCLTVDGQELVFLNRRDEVQIRRSQESVHLIKLKEMNLLEMLSKKVNRV